MVQERGLEPLSSFEDWLLRPARLPVPPPLQIHYIKRRISSLVLTYLTRVRSKKSSFFLAESDMPASAKPSVTKIGKTWWVARDSNPEPAD